MISIHIDPAAREAGFASMLTDLIQQNVEQHPHRLATFNRLRGTVAIEAKDAEVALTMIFLGSELVVHDGVQGQPDVVISTDSLTILELSSAKLRFGLPDLTAPSGRAVLRKIWSGELKISGLGLVLKPLLLVRFTKLLSVATE
jgi:hypothetical protein